MTALPASRVLEVTPAMAAEWLELNERNRLVKPRVVARYVRDMKAGNWKLTGEAIKFATNGMLLDGQHRLTAIVESGVTVPMLVVTGLEPEAQIVMDSGATRSGADAMGLLGEKYRANIAAACRLSILYLGGDLTTKGSKRQVSTIEMMDFLAEHPDLRAYVELSTIYRKTISITPSALAVSMWVLGTIDKADAAKFFEDLATLTGLQAGDPVLALHSRLTDILRTRRRVEAAEYMAMIFRAWNARREGRQLSRMLMESRMGVVSMPAPR